MESKMVLGMFAIMVAGLFAYSPYEGHEIAVYGYLPGGSTLSVGLQTNELISTLEGQGATVYIHGTFPDTITLTELGYYWGLWVSGTKQGTGYADVSIWLPPYFVKMPKHVSSGGNPKPVPPPPICIPIKCKFPMVCRICPLPR